MLFFQEIFGHCLLPFLFIRLTVAVGASERFTNPPDGASDLTYTLGSIIQITWQTELERIALTLFHEDGTSLEYLPDSANVTNINSYPWAVGSVINPKSYPTSVATETNISDKVFYFVIFNPGNTTGAITSNTFRIVAVPSASTSATTSSSSSSSSSSSTSAFISSTSPASSITTSTQPSKSASSTAIATSSGLSKSAKTGIGVGVGVGVGIPLLFALGIVLGWKFRGGRTAPNSSKDSHSTAVETPFTVGPPNFSRSAPHDPSSMNHFPNSHNRAIHEISEMQRNQMH